MNYNKIYGYNRDKLVVEIVDRFKCLDAEQIKILLFTDKCNPISATRQSQSRLRKLTENKLIKRYRINLDECFKYFITDFNQKEHITLLNWLFIYYLIKHPYEKVYHMEYQRDYIIKVPDLFLVTFNPWNREKPYKAVFFEMDKTISNKFDAIQKYNKLFESKPNDEFVRLTAPSFPKIIIATTDKKRLETIDKLVLKDNENKLDFDTHLIWDIREECKNEKVPNIRNLFTTNNVDYLDCKNTPCLR